LKTPAAGILLAAGRGRRFDPLGARNKLLQRLPSGEPVVAASARHLLSVFPQVVAVVAPLDGGVADLLRGLGCEVTVCLEADAGMGLSLAHAVAAAPNAGGWLVALGDMPFIAPSTLHALRRALEQGAGIAAPSYQGRRGNPVGFGAGHRAALLALEGDQGARRLLQAHPVTLVEVDDPGILRDVDLPADLGA
jgi:molybdenum cofactor cytidylyltransferase